MGPDLNDLNRVEQSWAELNRVEQSWAELSRVEQSWAELSRVEQSWAELNRVEVLNRVELLNRVEPNLTQFNRVGLGRKVDDTEGSGLNVTEMNWTGPKWIKLDGIFL